jgi:ribose 5-phosphate isomerase A
MALSPYDIERAVARAALSEVAGRSVIGVGSGSTADAFIDALAESRPSRLEGVVPASEASAARLEAAGIRVMSLADTRGRLAVAVDGCDEADGQLRLVKGAGGAMTREKVIASAAELFVVIAGEDKLVRHLGGRALPVEVLPEAEAFVAERLARLGGKARRREGFVTDNGGVVLDVAGLPLDYPDTLERTLAAIPGVVGTGLFALRPADVGLFATADGKVRRLVRDT